jgi:hypothetical protein
MYVAGEEVLNGAKKSIGSDIGAPRFISHTRHKKEEN